MAYTPRAPTSDRQYSVGCQFTHVVPSATLSFCDSNTSVQIFFGCSSKSCFTIVRVQETAELVGYYTMANCYCVQPGYKIDTRLSKTTSAEGQQTPSCASGAKGYASELEESSGHPIVQSGPKHTNPVRTSKASSELQSPAAQDKGKDLAEEEVGIRSPVLESQRQLENPSNTASRESATSGSRVAEQQTKDDDLLGLASQQEEVREL